VAGNDASYRSVRVGYRGAENAVWSYPGPIESAPLLVGYVVYYWDKMDTLVASY